MNHKKLLLVAHLLILAGVVSLFSNTFVKPYDTGDITRAYPGWVSYMDVTHDLKRVAINDNGASIFVFDHDQDDNRVSYILDERDFQPEGSQPLDVVFDREGNLCLYLFDQENMKNYLSLVTPEGRVEKTYELPETCQSMDFKNLNGFDCLGDEVVFVQELEDSYSYISINKDTGKMRNLATYNLENNRRIVNAEFDKDRFHIVFNDGSIYEMNEKGSRQICRFNFHINDRKDGNYYADFFTKAGDEYYFLDKKTFGEVYSYDGGEPKPVLTLDELLELDQQAKEKEYAHYMEDIVDNAFSAVTSRDDILEVSSNANLYFYRGGEITEIPVYDEGLALSGRYMTINLLSKLLFGCGSAFVVIGLILFVFYIIRYRFILRNKILLTLISSVGVSFLIIIIISSSFFSRTYIKDVEEKMVAVSSLMASGIDKELFYQVDDLDDVENGNLDKLRDQFYEMVDDNAGWNENVQFDLLRYNPEQVHYLACTFPATEECYLNSYFLRTPKSMEKDRIPGTDTYLTTSFSQKDYYVDAVTIIKRDGKPIGLVDVYGYQNQINEVTDSIKRNILLFGLVFSAITAFLLSLIARYITSNLTVATKAVGKISKGQFGVRIERITGDEVGQVARGINLMAEQLEQAFENQERFTTEVIETLVGTIDAKDKYTQGHSRRVAQYAKKIAQKLGKSEMEINDIYYAGLLHDIGKIGIPDSIIGKPEKLEDWEFEEIKKHPVIGYELLNKLSSMEKLDVGAYGHHERFDGRGYPQGLKGYEIPEIARIICVADSYDAMTSDRSYRKALTLEKVKEELRNCSGTQFDPEIASVMLDILEEENQIQKEVNS